MTKTPILHVKFVPFGKPRAEEKEREGEEDSGPEEWGVKMNF